MAVLPIVLCSVAVTVRLRSRPCPGDNRVAGCEQDLSGRIWSRLRQVEAGHGWVAEPISRHGAFDLRRPICKAVFRVRRRQAISKQLYVVRLGSERHQGYYY